MGDYSGAALDPSAGNAIWVAGEYSGSSTAGAWHTFIAQLRTPAAASVGGVAEAPDLAALPSRTSSSDGSAINIRLLAFAGVLVSILVSFAALRLARKPR